MSPSDPLSQDELLAQRRFVGALARRLVADAGRVDDVAQETYVQLLGARRRPNSLRGWLRAVVRNVVRQFARGEGRRSAREEFVAARAPTLAPATDEIAEQLELQRRLIDRVLALPPLYKDVVLLHFYEERTVAQTAERLGIPLETARTRLRRALEELRAGFDVAQGGDRAGLFGLIQLARLAPVSTATAVSTVSLGAWIAMAKSSKIALTAAAVALVGGGWWLWSGRGGRGHVVPPSDPAPLAAAVSATAPPPIAAERSAETGSIEKAPAPAVAGDFGSVRVHVTSAREKTPLANLPVRLFSEERAPSFVDEVQGTTDAQGDFFAPRVPVGSVIANAAGFMWWTGSSARPEFFERECTRRIAVRAGETTEIALSVYREVELDARVVDASGTPVAGATIWIGGDLGWSTFGLEFGRTDSSGRFHCAALEHSKWISAWAPGFAPSSAIQYNRFEKNGRVEVELQLADAGGRVFGSVVDAAGRPVSSAFVYVCGPWGQPRPLRDGTFGAQPPARTTRSRPDGTFDVEGAPLGDDIHLVVRAPGHAPAWLRFPLTAAEAKRVDVTLAVGGSLFGTLRGDDGTPLAGVVVKAAPVKSVPEPRSDVLATIAKTDDDGDFELDHLLAEPLEATLDAGASGTAKLSFRVADGEAREWNPELSRGSEIRGVVVDERGDPCVGWTILARVEKYEPGIEAPPDAKTDAAGRFALDRCSDRAYKLMVREPAADWRQFSYFSDVVVHGVRPTDGERRIEVPAAARASAFVDGRVVDDNGQPIESVALSIWQMNGGSDSVGEGASGATGFHLGPFPPGDYGMRLWCEGYPQIDLGKRTLVAGQILDLGLLTLPTPGFAEVRATHVDGSIAQDEEIGIWSEVLQDSEHIGRTGEIFRSAPLAPGHYLLTGGWKMAAAWIPFDVVAGQTVKLSITAEPGAIRSFRLVTGGGGPPAAPVQVTASIRDGRELWTHAWPELGGGAYVVAQRFAVGRFTIAFKAADGSVGTASFDVADLTDAKTPIEVTLR